MVVGGWYPASSGVTGTTRGAKTTLVCIFRCMASKAICGCAMEDFIDVTVRTGNCGVFARQFKDGQIMIVCGRGPAGSGVTFTTSGAKAALVRVFRCMARIAVGRCAL